MRDGQPESSPGNKTLIIPSSTMSSVDQTNADMEADQHGDGGVSRAGLQSNSPGLHKGVMSITQTGLTAATV